MKSTDPETISTYDNSARELAEYFAGVGSRVAMIEDALAIAGPLNGGKVVEVGCGDGRDAVDIVPRVTHYEGFDPSVGLIKLAKKRLPDTNFAIADAISYQYPDNVDVVFGFASFLHLNRKDFQLACKKIAKALRKGGVLLMTLKRRDTYESEVVEDEFGKRLFYYYDAQTVRNLVEDSFEIYRIEEQSLGRRTANWLLVILRKK